MKWENIKRSHPDKFILIGNLVEQKISENQSKILAGKVLKVSDNAQEIRQAYQFHTQQGEDVLYAIPNTPIEFIVENIPFKGIFR